MDVSIIFVNYKTKDLTINAIKSVIKKTEGLEYEIFVVDNDSQDGSIEAIQEEFNGVEIPLTPTLSLKERGSSEDLYYSPQSSHLSGEGVPVYIIKNTVNAGFGAANNLAIRQARGKYIFCLNTDTLLINNAIKIMFDFMEREENQNVGVCGGELVDGCGKPCNCGGHFPCLTELFWKFGLNRMFKKQYKKYSLTLNSDDKEYLQNIDYITGADIFLRKSVLDKVGLFDETFFMYYEETDLCKRIKNSGYDVRLILQAKICHLESKSNQNETQKRILAKESELIFYKKYKEKILFIKFLYVILYFINGYIYKKTLYKELLKCILRSKV